MTHLLLLLLLSACAGDKPPPAESPAADDTETGHESDTGAGPTSPCEGGAWGEVADPSSALVVSPAGTSGGAGTPEDPLDSLATALVRLRERGGGGEILVGPGRYTDAEVELGAGGDGSPGDGDVLVQGCPGATVLVGGRDDLPVLRVAGAQGVRLVDLDLRGGRGALWIWGGAGVSGARIHVGETRDAAVVIDGHDTLVDLDALDVDSLMPGMFSGGELGIGVLVQDADVRLTEPSVEGATRYGIFVRGDGEAHGRIDVQGGTVLDTAASGEEGLGRGLSAHDAVAVTLSGLVVDGAADAGVFLQGVREASLSGLEVREVEAGLAEGAGTGDGLVLTGVPADGSLYPPSLYQVTLGGLTGEGVARAGLLLERVEAELAEAPSADAYAQAGAVLSGDGAAAVTTLAEGEELSLTRTGFDPDELVGEP